MSRSLPRCLLHQNTPSTAPPPDVLCSFVASAICRKCPLNTHLSTHRYLHFLFFGLLVVILYLWRPTLNNQRYAYSLDADNADDDFEVVPNFQSDAMKQRNVSNRNQPSQQLPLLPEEVRGGEEGEWCTHRERGGVGGKGVHLDVTQNSLPDCLLVPILSRPCSYPDLSTAHHCHRTRTSSGWRKTSPARWSATQRSRVSRSTQTRYCSRHVREQRANEPAI